MLHVLNGMQKYDIAALDAWVWRIAHNRYARFCEARNRENLCGEGFALDLVGNYDVVDEEAINDEYETVFRCLHTLSSEYKNILVDYYMGNMSVKTLSEKYSLPETIIKWRLPAAKIRDRVNGKGEKT